MRSTYSALLDGDEGRETRNRMVRVLVLVPAPTLQSLVSLEGKCGVHVFLCACSRYSSRSWSSSSSSSSSGVENRQREISAATRTSSASASASSTLKKRTMEGESLLFFAPNYRSSLLVSTYYYLLTQ